MTEGYIVICDRLLIPVFGLPGIRPGLRWQIFVVKLNAKAVNGAKPEPDYFSEYSARDGFAATNNYHQVRPSGSGEKEFYLRVHQGYLKLQRKIPNGMK